VAPSIELEALRRGENMAWARAHVRAGAHVFHGAADMKTGAKVALPSTICSALMAERSHDKETT
jgi:polyphosphate kinase